MHDVWTRLVGLQKWFYFGLHSLAKFCPCGGRKVAEIGVFWSLHALSGILITQSSSYVYTGYVSLKKGLYFCCGSSVAIWLAFGDLTHWGQVMHILCISNLTIIGPNNGLSPGRRQAIIWTNAGILLVRSLRNFSEILSKICTFSFKKTDLKLSSAKWRPFCLGLNVFK